MRCDTGAQPRARGQAIITCKIVRLKSIVRTIPRAYCNQGNGPTTSANEHQLHAYALHVLAGKEREVLGQDSAWSL